MDDERCSFPARSQAWPQVRSFVERRCRALGVPGAAALRLELIAEELFINAAEHGGQGPGGTISMAVHDAGSEVELVLEDTAVPFDPFTAIEAPCATGDPDQRPVGGLGRALVAGLCSRSHYRRLEGRNRVTVGVRKAPGTVRPG